MKIQGHRHADQEIRNGGKDDPEHLEEWIAMRREVLDVVVLVHFGTDGGERKVRGCSGLERGKEDGTR